MQLFSSFVLYDKDKSMDSHETRLVGTSKLLAYGYCRE